MFNHCRCVAPDECPHGCGSVCTWAIPKRQVLQNVVVPRRNKHGNAMRMFAGDFQIHTAFSMWFGLSFLSVYLFCFGGFGVKTFR